MIRLNPSAWLPTAAARAYWYRRTPTWPWTACSPPCSNTAGPDHASAPHMYVSDYCSRSESTVRLSNFTLLRESYFLLQSLLYRVLLTHTFFYSPLIAPGTIYDRLTWRAFATFSGPQAGIHGRGARGAAAEDRQRRAAILAALSRQHQEAAGRGRARREQRAGGRGGGGGG